MALHSSVLTWRIPWSEEPGGLQSIGLQRVRHDLAHTVCIYTHTHTHIFMSTFVCMWVCVSHFCPVRILEQGNPNRNEHLLMLKSWLLKTTVHSKKSGVRGDTTDSSLGQGKTPAEPGGSCSARKQGSDERMMETWLKDTRASLSRRPLAKDGTI